MVQNNSAQLSEQTRVHLYTYYNTQRNIQHNSLRDKTYNTTHNATYNTTHNTTQHTIQHTMQHTTHNTTHTTTHLFNAVFNTQYLITVQNNSTDKEYRIQYRITQIRKIIQRNAQNKRQSKNKQLTQSIAQKQSRHHKRGTGTITIADSLSCLFQSFSFDHRIINLSHCKYELLLYVTKMSVQGVLTVISHLSFFAFKLRIISATNNISFLFRSSPYSRIAKLVIFEFLFSEFWVWEFLRQVKTKRSAFSLVLFSFFPFYLFFLLKYGQLTDGN